MIFELTDEQRMIKENARKFMQKEIMPIADREDKQGVLTRDRAGEIMKSMVPIGYLIGPVPETHGGAGLDNLTYGLLLEELYGAFASLGIVTMIQGAGVRILLSSGTEEQKKRYIPELLSLDLVGCGAITEPNVGSHSVAVETTAHRDGDHFVINGTKTWISNGSISDLAVIICRIQGEKGLHRLIVERSVSPYKTRELHKMGLRSAPTSELIFENCLVPVENRIGVQGEGLKETLIGFQVGRSNLAVGAVGIAQKAFDAAVGYARLRKQFGKRLGEHQLIQNMIADMFSLIEASRLLAYRSFYFVDKGGRAAKESSTAKYYCTESAAKVTSMALQIHGAYGLSDEFPIERYFRDARCLTIPDGTSEIQKLIVAREILGFQAFV